MNATVESAVLALRSLVKALKKRPDVVVDVATLGRKASKKALAMAQAQFGSVLDGELLQFFALMNGAEIRWHYVEGSGGGSMKIAPLTKLYRFEAESEHHWGFGDNKEALMFDLIIDEGASWIVRDAGADAAGTLMFGMAADGAEGVSFEGLAAYLTQAVERGLVIGWPMCVGDDRFSESMVWLKKFTATPVKPATIQTGTRVHHRHFNEEGRGTVVDFLEVEPYELDLRWPDAAARLGRRFARVALDVGATVWIPTTLLKKVRGQDLYEQLRVSFDAGDAHALVQKLLLALGPSSDNARRAAGLLGGLPIDDAIDIVFQTCDAIIEADGIDLDEIRTLKPDKQMFRKADFARDRQFQLHCVPDGLFGGLLLLLQQTAWIQNGNNDIRPFVPAPAVEKLESYVKQMPKSWPQLSRLLSREFCPSDNEFSWEGHDHKLAEKLGLPSDIPLFSYGR